MNGRAERERRRGRRLPWPASDPGLLRLTVGLRTVGAMVLTLALLAPFRPSAPLLVAGGLTAVFSTAVVREPLPRDQAVTLALGLPTACLSVTAGTLLAPYKVIADAVFVLVIFSAVYVRRFGQRGTALGLIAFQLFFVSQFIQARAEILPALYGVLVAAFSACAVVRFVLVRSSPRRTLTRLLGAFQTRLRQTVDAMVELTEHPEQAAGNNPRARAERRLRRRVVRLHECALMIQGRLDEGTPDAPTAVSVQRRVAGMEIAAERLVAILLSPERPRPTPVLTAELRTLREVAAGGDWLQGLDAEGLRALRQRLLHYREHERLAEMPAPDREPLRAAGELVFSGLGLRVSLGTAGSGPEDDVRTAQYREELETEELGMDTGPRGLERTTTRTAFQVTVGSAFAIAGGELLSTQRWYWAVLSCWVVFINTSSTGEILIKGYRRLAGTIIGVVAGVGLTGLVAGNTWLTLAAVVVCVFAMFYTASLSHLLMSFFTTAMLGLLYTLLHTYSTEVFILRIVETALGAACGLFAALFVLPVRTSEQTDEQLREVLEKMREAIEEAVRRLSGEQPREEPALDLLDCVHEMSQALDSLRSSTDPLRHPISPLRTRGQTARYLVRLLDSAGYHVRGLAATAEQLTGGSRVTPDPRVAEAAARLSRNLAVLTARLDGEREPGTVEAGAGPIPLPSRADDPSNAAVGSRVARHVQRLDEIIIGLAEPLEVRVG
ncbi:FUSC family protein [Streptomyces sp. TP-A0874]|uniref:FUSC family protein n=1 Tax=Streptomyces sp. TP-A0874 TaxID=549819 RepID=UPI000852AAAB|nr:FUSC family protein [Streptomyces sp. TP-A0874]